MQGDLARIAAGLPVASLWPLAVPYLAKSQRRVGATAAISALYILAPQIPSTSSLLPTLSNRHKGFAEYFLIGSLASLTIAVGAAAATRATLGIGPF